MDGLSSLPWLGRHSCLLTAAGDHQLFMFTRTGDDAYTITVKSSGHCLEVLTFATAPTYAAYGQQAELKVGPAIVCCAC